MNITLQVPLNTKTHGDPSLLCVPPQWSDYVSFFATNYVAHAATLIGRPGEGAAETLLETANALFIPGSGALRAFRLLVLYVSRLVTGTLRHTTPLEQAQRAGALCMLILETELAKLPDQAAWNLFFGSTTLEEIPPSREIYGVCVLPPQREGAPRYRLVEVPSSVPLMEYELGEAPSEHASDSYRSPEPEPAPKAMKLPQSRNIPKIIISILQVGWGVITLFRARGNQIDLYGYGAFGLTVAPYAIMSIINLVTNLLRPEYPLMYMVHTRDMDDAILHGGDFRGVVATVNDTAVEAGQSAGVIPPHVFLLVNMAGYLAICIVLPLAIVGGLTGFRSGENVTIATSWILSWLVVGSASALWVRVAQSTVLAVSWGWRVILVMPLWIPAIGGFVVVAQMLTDFGICTEY